MAASIESRVPFLDHPLVEFATNIPQNLQLGGFAGKRILKKAVEDLAAALHPVSPEIGLPHALEPMAGRPAVGRDPQTASRTAQHGAGVVSAMPLWSAYSRNIGQVIATITTASGVC